MRAIIKSIQKTKDLKYYDIKCQCAFCGEDHEVRVTTQELFRLNQGELVSDVLTNHSPTERDQLIVGICPKCQKEIFTPGREDEERKEVVICY